MAMARNLRLFAAGRGTLSSHVFSVAGPANQDAPVPERTFCTALRVAGNTEPLTLANLGFADDGQDSDPESCTDVVCEVGRRPHRRTTEKVPWEQTQPVTHNAPSAEEMKQAALEASYILAGIAGMRLRKPTDRTVTEEGKDNPWRRHDKPKSRGHQKEPVALAESAEKREEEEEEEEANVKHEIVPHFMLEAAEPAKAVNLNHPWPEWIEFLMDLQEKGFFEGTEEEVEEGKHLFETYAAVKNAVCAFGRTHSEIFNCLNRKDLRVLAMFGCPDVERKASNASKRLRAHFRITEGDVCQQCRLKMTCPRAFFAPEANLRMNTLDVVRIITSFASNTWPDADNHTSYPGEVTKSVCNLLREIVTYKILPKQTAEEEHVCKERSSVLEPDPHAIRKKVKKIPPPEPKPGDWTCPNCEFLNFNRNRRCRECHLFRPQQEQNAYIGDWHCPKCRYLNFSKNSYCRECKVERPTKVKWMGGERLPDDEAELEDLPSKEKKYEASDDGAASDMSLTNPDESSMSDGSLSEEEEKALSRGLANATRSLPKPRFEWDELKGIKKGFSDPSLLEKGLNASFMKTKRIVGRTSRRPHAT